VEALEALAGEQVTEQVEHLAHHALRSEVWDKALAYCRQAGEKVMARSAHREAIESFEQALSALAHLSGQRDIRAQAIDLRLALRSALTPSGDLGRVLAYLREAETLAMALDDTRRLGQVSVALANCFWLKGVPDEAIAATQRALACATVGGDAGLHAVANIFHGFASHAQGNYHRAIDCFVHTRTFFEEARHRERFGQPILPAVGAHSWLASSHAELGLFSEGRAFGEEGLRIAEAVAHPASLMIASLGLGLLVLRQGDLSRALPLLERAVDICQEADFPIWVPWTAGALGAAYTLAGRVADAVALLTQALEPLTATEAVVFQTLCRLSLGEAQRLADCLEEAHALAERTLALTRVHQERGHEAYALRLLGEIEARREPPEHGQAEAHYQQALALAEELSMRPLQAHCHRGLGTLYVTTGQRQQARQELTTAVERYRGMDMTFWLPQSEAALAQVEA
jgi:tetratricopeptide (TPR) repeat protein